ncbi:3-deoxy-manno-octulosonate cytidylyltransferase [Catenovulum maritimum]|uniref:3-deoxy-manno-octulosonate cytidylyltransferase n=1 Tax=Catenovulum maritimum TaxID=1513271 RepID=A0A0J8JHD7_9ALTE|nr:3-deoxy-manno-octulosonate cytidylyltransferase [Catenovulum maritimum]KMT63841.1 3-deoxy-manno-octulosonate cytidylyltransferase [Catenovulum maritimum]
MSYTIVIPARYASTRFPGKPLVDIAGKTMLHRVYKQCKKTHANRIIIATDDQRIADEAEAIGAECCITSVNHESGTERIAEVIDQMNLAADEIIVNVQGDEPFIPSAIIDQVANNMGLYTEADMATLSVPITDVEEVFNPNVVKVVTDKSGYALYFSRSTMPYDRARFLNQDDIKEIGNYYYRHIGIYAYRAKFVKQYLNWPASPLEQAESLEQLRVLWHGEKIHVGVASEIPLGGIDTPEDLDNAIIQFKARKKEKS